MNGIDISNHNGAIDFSQVKNSGVEVIIIKATEGVDFIDSALEQNYQGALNQGINLGFYHFMSEKTEPSNQAQDFYNAIHNKTFNILPVLDIETNNQGRNATEITDRCIEFLNKFKELSGLDCMIYTGGYFGRDSLDDRIKNYPAWIAHYGVETPMPTGFVNVVGHQYTETGSIDGIDGNVDMNNFNEGILLEATEQCQIESEQSQGDDWVSKLQNECNVQGFSNQAVDGIPGSNTLAGCPTLKPGSQGNITRLLQQKLDIISDGIFGSITEQKVKEFQAANGLVDDGIVGPNTWRALLGL